MGNELVFRCVFHSETLDAQSGNCHEYRFKEDRSKGHGDSTLPAHFSIELGEPYHPRFKVGNSYKIVPADSIPV